jgi:hypothetical protein
LLEFQAEPDPIFRAILDAALAWTRDQLYPYLESASPSEEQLQELDEHYREYLYPELARFMSRTETIGQIDGLLNTLNAPGRYRITDYHWMILHESLQMFCDLHNDNEWDGKVGPYLIETIDLDWIVERFFFDTDFAFGVDFLLADERREQPIPGVSPQARRIAAGLRPTSEDLEVRLLTADEPEPAEATSYPTSGYIGPYPMRERATDDEPV